MALLESCTSLSHAVTITRSGGLEPGGEDLAGEIIDMADPAMVEYRKHLIRRHLAASTVNRYMTDLRAFRRWLDRPLVQATTEEVETFLDSLRLEVARTRYRWLSQLGRFYGWAAAHEYVGRDPTLVIVRPRLSRLLPRPVDDETLRRALNTAGPQMRAKLCLAAYGGLRCGEIASLDRASIGPTSFRVRGKGGHERVVPTHPELADALNGTALARTGPALRRENGSPFTAKEVSRRGALFFEMLGYPGIGLHMLRHNFGTRIYKHSKDLRATQELLGHARIDTTAGYAAVGAEDLVAAMEALPSL